MNNLEQDVYMFLMVNQKVRFSQVCNFVHDKLPNEQRNSFDHYGPTYTIVNKLVKDGLIKHYIENGAGYVEIV